jgi:hypothetical protein
MPLKAGIVCRSRVAILATAVLLEATALCDAQENQELSRIAGKPFSIQQQDGRDWLINPGGSRFFSFGVCCVDPVTAREKFSPDAPAYAYWHHYRDSNHWAQATLGRLQSWGFTTIGGWSDYETLKRCRDVSVAFTPVLHVGSTAGAPWSDMWDPKVIERMHQVARQKILPLRDDPRLLGYYSDNEIGWWNAILFDMTLEQGPASGQRQRLIRLLRDTYHNGWSELLKDFEAEGIGSFDELDQRGMLYLRPGSSGMRLMRSFLGMLAERYYSLVREVIRKYDSRALILGDRYQSFYYPEVVRACAAHVDVASANLNAAWDDGTFPRFYLDTIHALTGKPILVSEFYMAAQQNRSGNKNDQGTFPRVSTQAQRVVGFANTLKALLGTPYVVGADWFQYYDEPTHGRYDGENYNFGLVDIHDRPYESLILSAASHDLIALKSRSSTARVDATLGVPPAPKNPLGKFTVLLALKDWDRERGFVKPVSEFPVADLYVCWDKKAIYLGLYSQDIVEEIYYRNKVVPEIDRAEWLVSIGGYQKPIHARLGPGTAPVWDEPAARFVNLSGIYTSTRNVAAIELPAKLFGKEQFSAGDTVELESTFFAHCRAYRVDWKGRFTLSKER